MGIELRELALWARNRKFLATALVVFTLALGILIGTLVQGQAGAQRTVLVNGATPLALSNAVAMSSVFSEIVSRDQPAVVNISITQANTRRGQSQRRGDDADPFHEFFDRFFDSPEQGPEAARSLGSGMIVDKKGFILTNHHVVEHAAKIEVRLSDSPTLHTARLVGADAETDLAVIKIDVNRDLPTVKLGDSDAVQVGEWVLAIGSPFGLQASVTAGIISAKDRGNIGRQFQQFLQTDAAINPGNSGGPLVNLAGDVIGINTAIISRGRGYEGIGFALPSATAIHVYNQIIEHGKVTRGSIGVSFSEDQSRDPVVLRDLGAPYGMVLQSIKPGSPADEAGLQPGDVITAVNGQAVNTGRDLVDPIAETPVGGKVRLTYMRDGQSHEATLTVADRTKIFPERVSSNGEPGPGEKEVAPAGFGLRVDELPPQRARRSDYGDTHGVVVATVPPAGFAEELGFLWGDPIAEISRS